MIQIKICLYESDIFQWYPASKYADDMYIFKLYYIIYVYVQYKMTCFLGIKTDNSNTIQQKDFFFLIYCNTQGKSIDGNRKIYIIKDLLHHHEKSTSDQ